MNNYEEFEKTNIFGKGEDNIAFSGVFTGKSYLNPLTKTGNPPVSLNNVTFEPGCRNIWHIHHAKSGGGQILVCTAGSGWYQEEGKAPISLEPGIIITVPANTKHWHRSQKRQLVFTYSNRSSRRRHKQRMARKSK